MSLDEGMGISILEIFLYFESQLGLKTAKGLCAEIRRNSPRKIA